MNNFLFIQNALSPNFLYYDGHLARIEDLKKALEALSSDSLPSKIFVNVGPGSYTGIRVGLAFSLALQQLGRAEIYIYDSFELISFLADSAQGSKEACVFIQSWPRRLVNLSASSWEKFKGYFKCEEQELFISIKDISPQQTVLYLPLQQGAFVFREKLAEFKSVVLYNDLLNAENIVKFAERKLKEDSTDSSNLVPKYISPVNITKPKDETISSI